MSVFKSDITVQLGIDRSEFHPGDSVTARVVVGDGADDRVQGGRVELAYENRYLDEERYRDSDGDSQTRTVTRSETVVAASQPLPGGAAGPVAAGEHTVTLTFPPQSPPSAHEPEGFGDLVRWEVRAILDRKMAFDPDAKQQVTVFSRPEQYASWAQSAPVSKSADCPMGLELSTRSLRPGEGISGQLTITPRESAKARAIRVQLERRRTDTPDNVHRTETLEGPQLAGKTDLEAGQTLTLPFEMALPVGVPPNFMTGKSNLHWFVEGIVDRRLKSDFVVEAEIVVYTGMPGPEGSGAWAAPSGEPVASIPEPVETPAAAAAAPGGAPDATAAPGSFPANWYPDPWLSARLRYWDGNAWTGHTAD
ncbi:MAG: Arrestin (or S-antigen), N-terminal domain [Thermoleophilaceae bacterium]|nr:Arrestin (or S-antigen), N-terminal domain [Thermoleophilaceae bacterium]